MISQTASAKGPVSNEHAGHGHSHEDVGDLDVPAGRSLCRHRKDQKCQAVGGDSEHQHTEEVVQPRRG